MSVLPGNVPLNQIIPVGTAEGTAASPATLTPTPEGTETAATDTWDRDSQGANDGLQALVLMRVVYDHSSDEKLYGFYRTYTYDHLGLLKTVSAETRYEIDAPEQCPGVA